MTKPLTCGECAYSEKTPAEGLLRCGCKASTFFGCTTGADGKACELAKGAKE